MTDLPVGFALDRAVAVAMGWTCHEIDTDDSWEYQVWFEKDGVQRVSFGYSTDPATLAEMLAWLQRYDSQRGTVTIRCPEGFPVIAYLGNALGLQGETEGATINEALCRLVLAVAKAGT